MLKGAAYEISDMPENPLRLVENTNTSIDYEIESFGDFLGEGIVTITNKIEKKTYGREQKAQDYFLRKGSADEQLLVVMEWDGDDDFLYKYWETEIEKEGESDFEGCIWDEEKQQFTQLSHEEMLKQSVFCSGLL